MNGILWKYRLNFIETHSTLKAYLANICAATGSIKALKYTQNFSLPMLYFSFAKSV